MANRRYTNEHYNLFSICNYSNDSCERSMREIFVFGSNLAGRHGKGAALHAVEHYGAKYRQGAGLQGNSYAIPTKNHALQTLPLSVIESHVKTFLKYVAFASFKSPDMVFNVTPIGCGLAGYKPEDIAPMFKSAWGWDNINLPPEFIDIITGE